MISEKLREWYPWLKAYMRIFGKFRGFFIWAYMTIKLAIKYGV